MRLVCLVALVGCAGYPHATTVPLSISSEREVLVTVVVDGRSLVFQLDTGASASAITPVTRDRLGLPHGRRTEIAGAGGEVTGEAVILHHVRVGDCELRDLTVAVIALEATPGKTGIDGVLGQDVLARYIAEIDLANKRLVLHPRGTTAWQTPDLVAIPYTLDEGLIRLDARLGDVQVAAILDLGANSTVASTKAASFVPATGRGQAIGADGQPVEVHAVGATRIQIGALALAATTIVVGDLPVFTELHLADRPGVLLGVDVLGARRLVIDPDARRVYISRD
jgi:hypothetical protein